MKKHTLILVIFSLFIGSVFLLSTCIYLFKVSGDTLQKDYTRYFSANETNFTKWKREVQKTYENTSRVSLIAVGDISYSRAVGRVVTTKNNINYPFENVKDFLSSGDIVFGNLETPITEGREIIDYEMVFRSDPGMENALKNAGFTIVSLANNHTMDFNAKGLEDTMDYLEETGISYVGAGINQAEAYSPKIIEKDGIKFALLAYTDKRLVPEYYGADETSPGAAFMDIERMERSIRDIRDKVDFVIVSMHSGIEYVEYPTEYQQEFAHAAIDSGADIVLGGHSHTIQSFEKYENGYVIYSLGNFVFDQMDTFDTRDNVMLKIYFSKDEDTKNIEKIAFVPTIIENYSQPRLAIGIEAERVLNRLNYELEKLPVYYWDENLEEYTSTFFGVLYQDYDPEYTQVERTISYDLNENGILEKYKLEKAQLSVNEGSKQIWKSSKSWWVSDFNIGDLTGNSTPNINVSLWKQGSFGEFKPFWVEQDTSIRNHLFIFDLIDNGMNAVWHSSNLPYHNQEMAAADINRDGTSELITVQNEYGNSYCKNNNLAIWKWDEWGLVNAWTSVPGNYCGLESHDFGDNWYFFADNKAN